MNRANSPSRYLAKLAAAGLMLMGLGGVVVRLVTPIGWLIAVVGAPLEQPAVVSPEGSVYLLSSAATERLRSGESGRAGPSRDAPDLPPSLVVRVR